METSRRVRNNGSAGAGRGFPLLALAAVPAAAGAGLLLDGTASWIVAAGAAAIGVTMAFASSQRAVESAASAASPSNASTTGSPRSSPTSSSAESLLRRATEVRCAERTAILEGLTDAVILVDAHGETRYANRAATAMLGPAAAVTRLDPGAPDALAAAERWFLDGDDA